MSSARVFFSLLHRDLKVLGGRLGSLFLDNIVMLLTNVAMFGYLLPLMGMSKNLIAPLFIGYVIMSFFELGYGLAIKIVHDVKFDKFIDYQLSLPMSTHWLLAEYITNFAIKACVVTLPILSFGILLLGNKFVIVQTHWLAFIFMYFLSLIFFATLFLYYSFAYDYNWFRVNLWSRRLEPLFLFGAVFIVWKPLYAFSKALGILFLLNPVTYVAEGLRATLIGGNDFLPIWICMLAVSVGIVISWLLLVPAMRKKLDLVNGKNHE